jgi:hypothetical protein
MKYDCKFALGDSQSPETWKVGRGFLSKVCIISLVLSV